MTKGRDQILASQQEVFHTIVIGGGVAQAARSWVASFISVSRVDVRVKLCFQAGWVKLQQSQ